MEIRVKIKKYKKLYKNIEVLDIKKLCYNYIQMDFLMSSKHVQS